MRHAFGQLLGFLKKDSADLSSITPERPFFAIGDLHGCPERLLTDLLAQLEDQDPRCPLVFLGDYIDRGEHSAGILERLVEMSVSGGREVICLCGNHEQMLLDFLADPEKHGLHWLNAGGLQTLLSYGLRPSRLATLTAASMPDIRDQLMSRLDDRIRMWLLDRPFYWTSGNVFVSHAGRDEGVGIDEQDVTALLWGPQKRAHRSEDGLWTVQGHLIVQEPEIHRKTIFVDTGAYATSKLSAAYISEGDVRFYSTRGRL